MKRLETLAIIILLTLIVPLSLFAQEYVSVIEGDPSSFRLYEPNGRVIDLTTIDINAIELGTILVSGSDSIILETSRGDIKLYPDSILILDEITSDSTTLLLIDGSITVKTEGALSVITPATLYELEESGEVYITSTKEEERARSFDAPLRTTNLITYKVTTINPMQELELSNPALAKRNLSPIEATLGRVVKPIVTKEIVEPTEVEELIVEEEKPVIRVPSRVGDVHWSMAFEYAEETVVPEEDGTEIAEVEELVGEEEPLITLPAPPAIQRVRVEEVKVVAPQSNTTTTQRTLRDLDEGKAVSKGSYGIEAGYRLTFPLEGPSYWPNHHLEVKPFVSYNSFALRLKAQVETDSFTSFDTNFLTIDPSALGITSYIFEIIDYLKVGYSTSPFYLLIEEGGYPGTQLAPFIAPTFPSGKMSIYNSISIGGFSLTTSFDDLRFTNILNNSGSQLASTVFAYTFGGSYPLSIALGTLAFFEAENSIIATTNLFPLLEISFPIINTRLTKLSALLLMSSYLPVYPEVEVDQFFDLNTTYFFPNHQLGVGLSVDYDPFNAQIMASLAGGKNHLMLFNSIAEAHEKMIEHDGLFDLYASGTWKSEKLSANLILNFPFTKEFTLATIEGETRSADFSQVGFSYDGDIIQLGLGINQVGLVDAIKGVIDGDSFKTIFISPWTSSFVEAAYTYKFLTFSARLNLPIALNGQKPTVDVGVTVRFEDTL